MNLIQWEDEEIDYKEQRFRNPNRDANSHRDKEAYRILQSERPFISWDGEGITYPGNPQQCYVLFASSTGDYITAPEGHNIGTQRCFDLLLRVEEQYPEAYHIGFGFGYDVNQILSSFSRSQIYGLNQAVKRGRSYKWNGYRIRIHPGKVFRVSKGEGKLARTVTIYDTFGFFSKRFIEVVRSYFPDELSRIESGKSNRGTFKYEELSDIIRYCQAENELLCRIMDRLREDFESRGLHLYQWYGPGAVANASLKLHGIKQCMAETPKEVSLASQLAYQGGRFELLRAGYYSNKVWQYDINSAYPSAIVGLPNLSKGSWEFKKEFERATFSVWNIEYRDCRNDRYDRYSRFRAQPFFFRDHQGHIAYTPKVEGWYWCPEIETALDCIDYPHSLEIKGGWVFRPEGEHYPFEYIRDTYEEKKYLKSIGQDSIVPKLVMNCHYGKFAQRHGWFGPRDNIPAYHQLEWAGYITSDCRAKLFRAYCTSPESIFSFETDSLCSTKPLDFLRLSDELGDWSVKEFTDILYLQSGFYFAHDSNGKVTEHYRGFDKGSIKFENVMQWLDRLDPQRTFDTDLPKLLGPTKRFIGYRRALQSKNQRYWRSWDTTSREISIGKDGKRIHLPGCPLCSGQSSNGNSHGYKWTEGLHGLSNSLVGGISWPHKIPWKEERYIENQWGEDKEMDITDGWEG